MHKVLSFLINEAKRTFFYINSKLRRFTFNKRTYRYFCHSYGSTWANERAVEVPIIWEEVRKHEAQRILELGNVLSHYYPVHHDIVDKYEKSAGVTNVDILDLDTSKDYDLIVSISTVEHIGCDEAHIKDLYQQCGLLAEKPIRDRSWSEQYFSNFDCQDSVIAGKIKEKTESQSLEEPLRVAVENLKSQLSQTGKIIITVPLGYNPALDCLLKEEKIFTNIKYLKRISKNNTWKEAHEAEIHTVKYNWSSLCANVLAVCVFERIQK